MDAAQIGGIDALQVHDWTWSFCTFPWDTDDTIRSYSNVVCLSPKGGQAWYELCLRDPIAGLEFERAVQTFWAAHVVPLISQDMLANMAADKANAVAGNWLPGIYPRLRWPYRSATLERCSAIGAAARIALPSLFV